MINDSDLATAWFGSDTNVQIGRLLGLRPRQVRSEFERLARAGIVPSAIREHVKQICRESRKYTTSSEQWHTSDDPIMGRQTTVLQAGEDRLLARLIEIHGSDLT